MRNTCGRVRRLVAKLTFRHVHGAVYGPTKRRIAHVLGLSGEPERNRGTGGNGTGGLGFKVLPKFESTSRPSKPREKYPLETRRSFPPPSPSPLYPPA